MILSDQEIKTWTRILQTLNSLGSTLLGTYRRAHITRALEKEHWGNICVE